MAAGRAQTPMMRQYFEAKEAHPGVLMAMRVGDFYEFYGDDAVTAAGALEITLTGRDDGQNGRIPMAGVPYHSVERYLARLVQQGFKVALCDQLEDPKAAKGLVKRGVTRVMTPGTVLEDGILPARAANYLAAICEGEKGIGLAVLDASTGEFAATQMAGEGRGVTLAQELARLRPAEVLIEAEFGALPVEALTTLGCLPTTVEGIYLAKAERRLLEHFGVSHLEGFGLADAPLATMAAAQLLVYAGRNGLATGHVTGLSWWSTEQFVMIDPATRRSLELTHSMSDSGVKMTLIGVLDETVTAMGARLMRSWMEQPLLDRAAIEGRLDAVGRFGEHALTRSALRECLKRVADIERLTSRCASGMASPRDLGALRESLLQIPSVDDEVRKVALGRIGALRGQLGDHAELAHDLRMGLVDEPPMTVREGGMIRPGFDTGLDALREKSERGKAYIAELEQNERKATGLDRLKVGYNSVFGYYLEVNKALAEKVPAHYVRKQTTANTERYITAELKEHESAVLGADEKANALEAEIFARLRGRVADQAAALMATARALAELDVLAGLAEVAMRKGYVRPELVEEDVLEIEEGRHPVVEAYASDFVPNSLRLDGERRLIVLTGPNMSGKSTYLRQTALIAVMAQMGSYVPAARCRMGLCDRIFTRIGARDELALGQSTFLVEMLESANILNNATDRSLVILDEVGRGTSTYDGLAIAWSMVEYLASVGAKTLFATHYHQLNSLEEGDGRIANFRIAVEEVGDDVIWTHRVVPGGADKSYGLQVARMAGVPQEVILRARQVLEGLEGGGAAAPVRTQKMQLTLFEVEEPEVVRELRGLNVEGLTPVQALMKLDELARRARG